MATVEHSKKEAFVRASLRDSIPRYKALLIRLAAIVISLIICAFLIYYITKINPLKVYQAMFEGAFGSVRRSWITVRDTMMLLCIAVGLAPAFKMKFWNIGAEGQILVGGITTAACMIYLKSLPTWLLFICMIVSSCIAGALWGLLPAFFKAKWNTNEILFTLMMNYVAIQLTSFFVALWENPYGSNTVGVINQNSHEGWLGYIFGDNMLFGQEYSLNVIIVMTLTILMFVYLKYSKHGYEIAVIGDSQNTARYAGISVNKVIIRTMLISGAVCGLSGFLAVSGASHTISTSTAGGKGFTAIIVAWLAKFNTLTMIAISVLIVFLEKGAIEIASQYNLNDYVSSMITGIILFFILGSEFFIRYKLVFRKRNKEVQ